jgi:hypothetical protein
MSWSLERLIKGGDVTGECDARNPGSDGASPYPELLSRMVLNFAPFLSVSEIFVVETELMPLQKR